MPIGTNTSGHLFDTTFTTEGVLYSEANGVVASTAAGSAGQVLQSGGAGADPAYSTPTYPSSSGTSRKILVSDGTNNVYSTETWAVPGSSGNVLTSDGTNWTSAAPAASGFSSIVVRTYSTDATYTPTSGMKYCVVELVGGGGGGGGGNATGVGEVSAGGGGGGGGYNIAVFSAATIGANQAITIGTAGTAGSATGGVGGTGGTTSLGALLTATGGVGGTGGGAVAAVDSSIGGTGGSGVTPVDSIVFTGCAGVSGWASFAAGIASGGTGGASAFGGAGRGSVISTGKQAGANGGSSGGGGGGSCCMASQGTGQAGGTGAVGAVKIIEFI